MRTLYVPSGRGSNPALPWSSLTSISIRMSSLLLTRPHDAERRTGSGPRDDQRPPRLQLLELHPPALRFGLAVHDDRHDRVVLQHLAHDHAATLLALILRLVDVGIQHRPAFLLRGRHFASIAFSSQA